MRRFNKVVNLTFVVLEVHMYKFILFIIMVTCIYDKSPLYLIVIFLTVVSIILGRKMQMLVIYFSSIFASLLLLTRMIYQIQYIKHDKWNVTCEVCNNYLI